MKLKRGRGEPDAPDATDGPHAHYFSADGHRVDQAGKPVEARSRGSFRPIAWDLPEGPAPPAAGAAADLAAALELACRSARFRALLGDVFARGWLLSRADDLLAPGCRKGPDLLSVDLTRPGGLVAQLVLQVAQAHALADSLPVREVATSDFARNNALFLIRAWGKALLDQAIVRDEILAVGGADIGGPGLRGLQQEAYDVYRRRDDVPLARVVDAIAFSVDGAIGASFVPGDGPPLLANLDRAFVRPPRAAGGMSGGVRSDDVLGPLDRLARRVDSIDALDPVAVFQVLDGVELTPGEPALEQPYLETRSALPATGGFQRVELVAPAGGVRTFVPRVLLYPRRAVTRSAVSTAFGDGIAHGIDLFDGPRPPLATAVHRVHGAEVFATYAVAGDQTVAVFAVRFPPG